MYKKDIEVSVVLPCKNEEQALRRCIEQIKRVFKENDIRGEIIVSDSSTDKSPEIARNLGAVLVKHDRDGYGNAYIEGFKHVQGRYIFCADPDASYDFKEIPRFLRAVKDENTLVIGNRFRGDLQKGSMPFIHKYIGNPFLSFLLRVLFGGNVGDAHCGMRAMEASAMRSLKLKTPGMELASEMVVNAIRDNMNIVELPINYYKRKGRSKIRTFRDGWRHVKFLLSAKYTNR